MALPVPDRDLSLAAARAATDRFTSLLRSASPARTAIGHWTTAELATHVGQVYGIYVDCATGGSSPVADHLTLSQTWDEMVAADPERDLGVLAERISKNAAAFFEGIERCDWEETVNWNGGLRVPAYALPSIILTELDVHGRDIALAEEQPWDISRSDATMAIQGLMTVMPDYLNREATQAMTATYELALRGAPKTYFQITNGTMTISTEPPGAVDCRISVDPVEYLLIGYGRKSQWAPILTGKVVAWGRKPWLGLKFAKLFYAV